MPKTLVIVTLLASTAWMAPAHADPAFLDALAEQRNAALNPRPLGAIPPQRPQAIRPDTRAWLCMSTPPYTPIRAEPRTGAAIIGYTQTQAAVSYDSVPGYARVLLYNGKKVGFVPEGLVRPYVSEVKQGVTCVVEGLRPGTGAPLFGYH